MATPSGVREANEVGGNVSTTNGRMRLSETERRVLFLIACLDGAPCPKAQMAERVGRCVRSVDRAVKRLRQEGAIESVPTYAADGGQAANSYRVTSVDALAEALRRTGD